MVLEQFKLSAQVLFCRGAELVLAEMAKINKRSKAKRGKRGWMHAWLQRVKRKKNKREK